MSEDGLHVVFGVGQVGRALSACLAGQGLPVRAVSRQRPAGLAEGVDWRAADASTFGAAGTPLADAVAATVGWYRYPRATPTPPPKDPIRWPAQTPS